MRRGAWGLAICLWGCAHDAPPPAAPDGGEPPASEPARAEPAAPAAREAPPEVPEPTATVGSDDYELSHRDCRALARAYGRAWVNDELEKLAALNLEPARREEAATEIDQDGAEMHDNWLRECEKTVGTAYRHESLACAMKAKTMKAFDDCWQGR